MNFDEYYEHAKKTRKYHEMILEIPDQTSMLILAYCALGLNGEAGEVADEFKKIIRNDKGDITPERREKIKGELGDVLWYWAALVNEMGFTFYEVAQANIDKLAKRYEKK